jgi:hypothetical protein
VLLTALFVLRQVNKPRDFLCIVRCWSTDLQSLRGLVVGKVKRLLVESRRGVTIDAVKESIGMVFIGFRCWLPASTSIEVFTRGYQ